ncbi:MAG: Ppx/GppA family phosphatase [Alphaproteobacteria bacterium]|nr:Ppx/GppA family phosphatase [Alphaproteobacteria bacterium]
MATRVAQRPSDLPGERERLGPVDQRLRGEGKVGVIDIGSNSIRLVVFDRLARVPIPIFNEKVMCGLGRGIEETGRLDAQAIDRALVNLRRFMAIAGAMKVGRLEALATAAVRDAKNGAEFAAEVARACGIQPRVLDGAEEARLSAMGVLAAEPAADGVMGDLGGGSLELVELKDGGLGRHATMPLGPLRVMPGAKDSRRRMKETIEGHLNGVPWLKELEGRDFHPVGGAWRALARVHMEQTGHPLHVIHNYELHWDETEEFLQLVSRLSPNSLSKMYGVSRRRHETLPYAALLMIQLARLMKPRRIVFSAYGLREGWMFDALPAAERQRDPLIAAASDHARESGRFGEDGLIMADWMGELFADETPALKRLRRAACLFADIGWLDHPDYRAEHGFNRVLRMPVVGVDHPGRAYLAVAVFARYGGERDSAPMALARKLANKDALVHAWRAGLAMRFGLTLTAGMPGLLNQTILVRKEKGLALLPADAAAEAMIDRLMGEMSQRRMDALSQFLRENEV